MQVQADAYDKIDRQLLGYVEDVLLNRREDATERILEFAALLDPKSAPTAVKRLDGGTAEPAIPARVNPIPADFDPVAVTELPPVPQYKAYV